MGKEFGKMELNSSLIGDLANEFTDEFAVINEIIANAYDAQATHFKVILDKDKKQIIFIDNGIGMNDETAKKGFLNVSKNKRESQEYKDSSRVIMGRKGSGRIGLFALAKYISVYSQKLNSDPVAFFFNVQEILKDNNVIEEILYDDKYMFTCFDNNQIRGTKIVIHDFFMDNVFENIAELNYEIYENFFPILTDNSNNKDASKMYVEVIIIENQEEIHKTVKPKVEIFKSLDRFMNIKDFDSKETMVKDAELKKDNNADNGYNPNTEKTKEERIIEFSKYNDLLIAKKCKVKTKYNAFESKIIGITKGWLGTLATITEQDEKNYNVKVYARNRLVIKDIRAEFKIDRFYLNYLVGDIFVDDLDDDELKDITKISRNAYGNQDERYDTVVKLVKAMAQKLIAEKSNIAKKNKRIANAKNTEVMKKFLSSARDSFSLDKEKFERFEKVAVESLKVKSPDDKRIIFISHKSIHCKDEKCYRYKPNDLSESLCFTSFLLGLVLVVIFEKIKKVKKYNDENFKIIFTSLDKYSVNFGENIHEGLRKEGFDIHYFANTLFYACISCKYIENWNTDIEYGASWFTRKKGTFCLIDPLSEQSILPAPINAEDYKTIIVEIKENKVVNLDKLLLNYDTFNRIFIKPLNFIGIKLSETEYKKYIVNDFLNIEKQIIDYFNLKYIEKKEKLKYLQEQNLNPLV